MVTFSRARNLVSSWSVMVLDKTSSLSSTSHERCQRAHGHAAGWRLVEGVDTERARMGEGTSVRAEANV